MVSITENAKDGENMIIKIDFESDEAIYIQLRNQIIMGIEEEFDIEIPTEEAEKIASVGDAVEAIKNALN